MNSDQVTSSVQRLLTALGSLLVAMGVIDADHLGPLIAAITGVLGGGLFIYGMVSGWLAHRHDAQIAAAARSIAAKPDATTVAPITQALRAEGAVVDTSSLAPAPPI